MTTWDKLSEEIKAVIIAYYEKKYDVVGIIAVKNALTQKCFEESIDEVFYDIKKRSRRQKVDTANKYEPTDAEKIASIQAKTNAMG